MNHFDENIIELYYLNAKEVSECRNEIEAHLKICPSCSELFKEVSNYYKSVDGLLKESSEEQALVLSEAINLPEVSRRESIVKKISKVIPFPIVRFIVYHPAISSLSFAAIIIGFVLMFNQKIFFRDPNLSYAIAKEGYLVSFDKNNNELWRKYIDNEFDEEVVKKSGGANQFITVIDVNGDSKNDIIVHFPVHSRAEIRNIIICYNNDGSERWRYKFSRQISSDVENFTDSFSINYFIAGDFDKNGKVEIIATVRHTPYYPSAVVKLDAESGNQVSEYWHPGHIGQLKAKDFNQDGIDEIFLFDMENNGLNLAPLCILDPRNINGCAPSKKGYLLKNIPSGNEMYYIVFPRTDLAEFSERKRNFAQELEFTSDGFLRVVVKEVIERLNYGLHYYFDRKMNCIKVGDDDVHSEFHKKLEKEGKLTKKLDEKYYEDLRKSILYWDGEKIVNYPTMNRKYKPILAER